MNLWFSWCDLLAFVQQWSCTGCAMQEHGPVQYQCAQLLPGWGPTTCVWEIFSLMWWFYSAGFSQNLFALLSLLSARIEFTRPQGDLPTISGLNLTWVYCVRTFFAISSEWSTRYLNTAPPIGLASECEIWESRISESFTGRSVMLQCHQKQDCRPSLMIFVYLNISDGWTQL